MIYQRVSDKEPAQATYLVGCPESREADLCDPARDIDRYEREAESLGLRIVAVAETHHHADFVSGMRAPAWNGPSAIHEG
ncbi:MAG: MBL fold metallo-hydrolase, partial [Phycisphaerales bacterium]